MQAIIVDKDATCRTSIRQMLHKHQYRVFETDDCEQAVRAYITLQPTILVIEQDLVKFTGLELAYFINCLHDREKPRIIMHTDIPMEELMRDRKFRHINDYVRKDDMQTLHHIIKQNKDTLYGKVHIEQDC